MDAAARTRSAPTKPVSRQHERRRSSDARMLRAAMNIIAEKGVAGATLAEIGVAAGFSRGLPAERFGTKLAMLLALMDFMEGWFRKRVGAAVAGKSGLAALHARVDAHIDSACISPVATAALYALLVESLCAFPELQPRTRALSASFLDGFRGHLEQAKRSRELHPRVDCARTANIVVGMLRGLIIQSLLEGDATNLAEHRAQIHSMIDIGLRKAGAAAVAGASVHRRRSG